MLMIRDTRPCQDDIHGVVRGAVAVEIGVASGVVDDLVIGLGVGLCVHDLKVREVAGIGGFISNNPRDMNGRRQVFCHAPRDQLTPLIVPYCRV